MLAGRLSDKMSGELGKRISVLPGIFYAEVFMEISLARLTAEDREQFIRDNQWAFKHGAMVEFGERDKSLDADGEIISRRTIEKCIDGRDNETFRIMMDGRSVGGVIVKIDKVTQHNHLEILFVNPEEHTKGIGYAAWKQVEGMYPQTKVWETCTPYFEKRNIHFYVNKCGFHIDQFWCDHFQPDDMPDEDEGPGEMFRFIKVMK